MSHEAQRNDEIQQCITDCQNCAAGCLETMQHCLMLGGQHAAAPHITLLADCAEICQTSGNFMLRGSEFHADACRACAVVCHACDDSCRRIGADDETMRACADACRKCAESCERMAGATAQR